MFKIGDFSKFSRVSVKMLRHYDEIGLLIPAFVDPDSNYRYYSAEQLPRLNRIVALKDLGFSLDQIRTALQDEIVLDELRGMLKLRSAEIQQALERQHQQLREIEHRLWSIEQERGTIPYDVVLRAIPSQQVASIRQIIPSMQPDIRLMFETLEAYAVSHNARAEAAPMTIFHDCEYKDHELDVEVIVPLSNEIEATDDITVYRLPEVSEMACLVYTGDYQRIEQVMNFMLTWLETNGYAIAGPLREVYLRFGARELSHLPLPEAYLTDHREFFVTEIQLPVKKTNANKS